MKKLLFPVLALVLALTIGLVPASPVSAAPATLTVNFPGISGVHVYVRADDGTPNSATGSLVAQATYQNNSATLTVADGVYDVVVVQGAKNKIVDAVGVVGDTTVDGIVSTLTVNFPGISGVHVYVTVDDGVIGTATGGAVASKVYQNGSATLVVLKGTYDIVVVQGAKQKIVDAVDATGDTATVSGIVSTLTVNFPGISGVHVYVTVDDSVVGTAAGGAVASATYKTDSATLVVLKGTYDVKVVQGAKNKIVDAVGVVGDTTVGGIVSTLTVNFPGISGVHVYVTVDDGVIGTATGGGVASKVYQNGSATLVVLKGTYDVKVVQGAKQKIVDGVDATGDTALVDGIVSTLTVNFPGISSVHVYVTVDDGVVGTAAGGAVASATYKTDSATLVVLKGTYDVKVVQGAKQKIVDGVDATGDTATVSGIVSTLTVNFLGISSVHVYVRVDDGIPNSATGGLVASKTYQTDSATFTLLTNRYDVVVDAPGTENDRIDDGVLVIALDIKPGTYPNDINLKSKGVIPVAILGHDAFDVTIVNVTSLKFGPSEATPTQSAFSDVNGDGYVDLISHYRTQQTGITSGDTAAWLKFSIGGVPYAVSDSIVTVDG